jgi:tRNA nucleotidyltransferase (CCA-adding enzyme)
MAEFIELARGYLAEPSKEFFVPILPLEMAQEEFDRILADRGTSLIGIVLDTPPLIPEVVVPQLRKSLESIRGLLERNGFVVNRADCTMGEKASLLLFELLVDHIPRVRRHLGPPLWSRGNAEKFFAKYTQPDFSGPYIENGLYVVEVCRRHTTAASLLRSEEVIEVALGRHVRESMEHGWSVCVGPGCWTPQVARFLHAFLFKSSPLDRIRKNKVPEGNPAGD